MKVIIRSINTVIKIAASKIQGLAVYAPTAFAHPDQGVREMSQKSVIDTGGSADGDAAALNDDANMGREQTEKSYKEWKNYWSEVQLHKSSSIIEITEGSRFDWNASANVGNAEDALTPAKENQQWVFALRHGERVDLTYGPWVPYCFDSNGTYTRKDLNMPETLAERAGGAEAYAGDTPLTRVGQLQAQLVGEGLRAAGVRLDHVYASGALRSVATAHHLLLGLEADPAVKIKVEPGIFEFKGWYAAKGMAPFMTPEELRNAGYNVDLDYEPYVNLSRSTDETEDEYYKRNALVMHSAVRETEATGGNIMFVGHAATLDIMVTAMKNIDDDKDVAYKTNPNLLRVPYCALAAVRGPPWALVPPPCPPSGNTSSGRFDWRMLKDI